jgi:hypothetical protein
MIRCWMVFQIGDGQFEVRSHHSSSAQAAREADLLSRQTGIHHGSIECILPREYLPEREATHTNAAARLLTGRFGVDSI